MIKDRITSKRASVNGVTLHYVTVGSGPTVLCLHGWPQNHREFVPIFECFAERYRFIVPDLRGYADSDKPYADYLPATIAQDLIELVDAEGADRFHVLSHDLGGPPAVALAYMAGERAISLSTIEAPFFEGRPRCPRYNPAASMALPNAASAVRRVEIFRRCRLRQREALSHPLRQGDERP
jgi:pimeloyl-ACP methyl ester carboxylesterase